MIKEKEREKEKKKPCIREQSTSSKSNMLSSYEVTNDNIGKVVPGWISSSKNSSSCIQRCGDPSFGNADCCSMTSWIAVRSDSSILSNSSIAHMPISARTWNRIKILNLNPKHPDNKLITIKYKPKIRKLNDMKAYHWNKANIIDKLGCTSFCSLHEKNPHFSAISFI